MLQIAERQVSVDSEILELHQILTELLHVCLDEIKTDKPDIHNVIMLESNKNKHFEFISNINKLIWLLLNSDCVTFYTTLVDIRY